MSKTRHVPSLLAALVLAAMAATMATGPAQAVGGLGGAISKPGSAVEAVRQRGGLGLRGGGFRHGGHRYHRRWHHGPRVFFYAAPVVSYRYVYSDDCGWLKRRYYATGHRHWWHRYLDCRGW